MIKVNDLWTNHFITVTYYTIIALYDFYVIVDVLPNNKVDKINNVSIILAEI